MKFLLFSFSLIFVVTSCDGDNLSNNPTKNNYQDNVPDSGYFAETLESDIELMAVSILTLLKDSEYYKLVDFIHPVHGVRFSTYAYIDTVNDIILNPDQFKEALINVDTFNWGYFDGEGSIIHYTLKEYIKNFVYDADFLNAEKFGVNEMFGNGNSLNNLEEIYGNGYSYTESYFSGFNPELEGLDWNCLRLVFKSSNGMLYLVGIVHDEWTI